MSDTIHLACVTCKRYLWVGQGGYAVPTKAYLYESDEARQKFSKFYDDHLGHDIRLVGMDGLDRLEGADEFEDDGECSEGVSAVPSPGMRRFVTAPGEDLRPGDLIGIDPATGKMRKVTPQHSGQKYTLPPGSRVTDDGYLEMPYNPPPIQ